MATKIAKCNLIVKFQNKNFKPNIYNLNTLTDFNGLFSYNIPFDNIDVITTNPPWGVHFTKEDIEKLNSYFPQIASLESFSYFIIKGYEYLKKGGILSFILPESILNVKTHIDIRKFILKNFDIIKVESLGRAFKNVFTKVIRLDLRKSHSIDNWIKIKLADKSYEIKQERFTNNFDRIFDIHLDNIEEVILDKIFNYPHKTLKNNAEWALGIVTGDNDKFVSKTQSKNMESVYRGSDIQKYFLNEPKRFISFNPERFQQVAPEEKYRVNEKLIYRFISSKLIFAYDNEKRLTLNSANILIPKIEGYPVKIVAAFLNSSLLQFIYIRKFNSIKVLRSHLETLPFPELSNVQSSIIMEMVNNILDRKSSQNDLDNYIFDIFNFSKEEKNYTLKFSV